VPVTLVALVTKKLMFGASGPVGALSLLQPAATTVTIKSSKRLIAVTPLLRADRLDPKAARGW
jgi:hypothetical protein